MTFFFSFLKRMFISVARSGWLEGSVSMSSLQFHFLQTLEHRTDVSVTSTSLRWEAPGERPGCQPAPAVSGSVPGSALGSPRCPPAAPSGVSAPRGGWLVPVVPLAGGAAWHHLAPRASLVRPRSPSSSPSLSRCRWGWKPLDL